MAASSDVIQGFQTRCVQIPAAAECFAFFPFEMNSLIVPTQPSHADPARGVCVPRGRGQISQFEGRQRVTRVE